MKNYLYTDSLQTDRIITRMLTEEDIVPWSVFFKDKESIEFFAEEGFANDMERSRFWIKRQLKRYADQRYGLQAIMNRNTNEFVGLCGLLAQEVDGKPELEVGYHVFKKHWGKGYAPEAAKLFIDFAFQHHLAPSVISIIHIDNLRSQRVADKNGLQRQKETQWSGLPVYIYRINHKQ